MYRLSGSGGGWKFRDMKIRNENLGGGHYQSRLPLRFEEFPDENYVLNIDIIAMAPERFIANDLVREKVHRKEEPMIPDRIMVEYQELFEVIALAVEPGFLEN